MGQWYYISWTSKRFCSLVTATWLLTAWVKHKRNKKTVSESPTFAPSNSVLL